MPSFAKGPAFRDPVGVNRYLRSPYGVKTRSATVASSTITTVTTSHGEETKVLQPGTVLARITDGAEAGKVGPFQPGTLVPESAVITDESTGGTYAITVEGTAITVPSGTQAAALVELLVRGATVEDGDLIGYDTDDGEITLVFVGPEHRGVNVTSISVDDTNATGGDVTVVATNAATSAAGATDGRGQYRNIVGINDTYLPTQLARRDVEVAVVYDAVCYQDWCLEYNGADPAVAVALSDTTAQAMRMGKALNILFVNSNPEAS